MQCYSGFQEHHERMLRDLSCIINHSSRTTQAGRRVPPGVGGCSYTCPGDSGSARRVLQPAGRTGEVTCHRAKTFSALS